MSRLSLALLLLSGLTAFAAPPADKPVRLDAHGDPLPQGALARLGTSRLRPGDLDAPFALSPDGKSLLTGEPQWLRLWDIETGKEVWGALLPDALRVHKVAFSPDGGHVVAGVDTQRRSSFDPSSCHVQVAERKTGKL